MAEWSEVHKLDSLGNVKTAQDQSLPDYNLAVAQGLVAGTRIIYIAGRRDGVETGGLVDIGQTDSINPGNPGGIQLEVVSDDALDNDATGTGIKCLDIHFLDSNFVEQIETVIMTGLAAVLTTSIDINRIQSIHAKSVGSAGAAVGNITIQTVGGAGVIYDTILIGRNQSLAARYSIPAGHKGYLIGWHCSAITKKIDFFLRATVNREDRQLLPGVFLTQDAMVMDSSPSGWINFEYPIILPALAEVKISALSIAAGGDAGCMFGLLLIAD